MSLLRTGLALRDLFLPAGSLLPRDALAHLPRWLLSSRIRARCQVAPLDAGTLLCRVFGRYKMLVDAADRGLSGGLLLDGSWELGTAQFLARHLRPGQVAWDVGANLGCFTLLMADFVGRAGKVVALEPNPRMAQFCRQAILLNGYHDRCRIEEAAASDRAGTLRFRDLPADPKNAHVIPAGTPRDRVLGEYEVRGVPLDEVGERVDLLKIDVEGAEAEVWSGMQRLLDRNPTVCVLLEFNPLRLTDAAALLRDIAGRFPLAELTRTGRTVPVTAETVLARPRDTMLHLTRA
jgi:FkbM family methyltransferase